MLTEEKVVAAIVRHKESVRPWKQKLLKERIKRRLLTTNDVALARFKSFETIAQIYSFSVPEEEDESDDIWF